MSNTLVNQMREANTICNNAYAYFAQADNIRAEAEKKLASSRKINIAISVLIAIVIPQVFTGILTLLLTPIVSLFHSEILMHFGEGLVALVSIVGVAAVVLFYKRVLSVRSRQVYDEKMAEADSVYQSGETVFLDNIESLSIIPSEYWYPMATEYMIRILETNRAETVNKALAMYDEYYHRWRMEESNRAMLEQQESILAAARSAERNSAVAAAAGVASVISNISRM